MSNHDILLKTMIEAYDHQEVEARIAGLWEDEIEPNQVADPSKKPFSIFLTPPNASGPMHIGNALMIAIQDILSRYHRLKRRPTLWVPSTDHGGYETQILLEKQLESEGKDPSSYKSWQLFQLIFEFAEKNRKIISTQIKSLGASVDWTRYKSTLDDDAVASALGTFRKMVADGLIYRAPYMVNYCSRCATILSDIELKEEHKQGQRYFIRFPFRNMEGELVIPVERPEFLFATSHILVHPSDTRYSDNIGRELTNPSTGESIKIIASKRRFNPAKPEPLTLFNPSHNKYDYTYALQNDLPSRNLLDWDGKLIEHLPGLTPAEARVEEVRNLTNKGCLEKVDEQYVEINHLCKRGHPTGDLLINTWFLKLNDKNISLRQDALDAIKKERLIVIPQWRERGLLEWISKVPDWPISRQNVWGIQIPVWYEIDNPANFRVTFSSQNGERHTGSLDSFLDNGYTIDDIANGLERLYAGDGSKWTLEKEDGKVYLPETDTFDTWFSSGQWATNAYVNSAYPDDISNFYPSDSIVIGQDLLRLSVARKLMLSQYLSGKLPFKVVYLHQLIKGADGQKMSKSLGNATDLNDYLTSYGADATRMTLVSYTNEREDFIIENERLEFFRQFCDRLWKVGRVANLANVYELDPYNGEPLSAQGNMLFNDLMLVAKEVGNKIEKYRFAHAQEIAINLLPTIEKHAQNIVNSEDINMEISAFKHIFGSYISLLHPFIPFITEELHTSIYDPLPMLVSTVWPTSA